MTYFVSSGKLSINSINQSITSWNCGDVVYAVSSVAVLQRHAEILPHIDYYGLVVCGWSCVYGDVCKAGQRHRPSRVWLREEHLVSHIRHLHTFAACLLTKSWQLYISVKFTEKNEESPDPKLQNFVSHSWSWTHWKLTALLWFLAGLGMGLIVLSSLIPILHSLTTKMKICCCYYYGHYWWVLRVVSNSCSDLVR